MSTGTSAATGRPTWLTAGTRHMVVLIVVIGAVEMIPVRLTVERAWLLFAGGMAVVALGALLAVLRQGEGALANAVLRGVRFVGLPLLGLAFFGFWTILYAALWAYSPGEAFGGVGDQPRLADFFYYAVSTAFTSPPEGIVAGSRGVRSATKIELFTALALLGVYLSSFGDWLKGRARDDLG